MSVGGVRSRLADDFVGQYDKVRAALEAAMGSTRKSWAYCPKCSSKVQADFPDHSARIKAIELWLEQGFGRAATAATESPAALGAAQTVESLESMSDDQLAAVVWASSSER